MPEKLEVK